MRSFGKVCAIFVSFLNAVAGARILAVLGVNMRSHLNAFSGIVEHLAPYHDVTFVLSPELKYSYPNVTNIHIPGFAISNVISKNKILENPCNVDYYSIYYYHILHEDEQFYTKVYSDENFQRLMNSDQKFDVLILSSYGSDHLTILAHKFDIPIIQVSPSILFPWTNQAVGNPNYFDNDYSFAIDEYTDTFTGRLVKYIKNHSILRRYYKVTISKINKVWKKYFPDAPPAQDLLDKTELAFINIHNSMGFPRSVATTVVEVGGMHVKAPKALPKYMEEFVSGPEGFIFFSLGSFITDSKFHPNMLKAMLNVFGKLKQKVLWKWNGEMEGVPKNVMVSKWFPQQDLLAHKDIKLFITQGGMMSLIESCSYGIPVMVMPVLFDQKTNAYLLKKLGYGLELDFCNFSEEIFYEKITDLISNATYKEQALQISSVLQYDRATVRDKINFWVNFVVENKRKSILRKSTPLIPWSQTTPVDIFLLLSTVTVLVIISTVWVSKRMKLWERIVKNEEKVKSH